MSESLPEEALNDSQRKEEIDIQIKATNTTFSLSVSPHTTVLDLKKLIDEILSQPPDITRLVYKGKVLESDDNTLFHYGVIEGSIIYAVTVRSNPNAPGGSAGAGSLSEVTQQTSQMETMISSMMESPFMKQLLQNPGFMDMFMQSPQMQQLAQNNPELRAVINDPATMRELTRVMQNPNLRKELIRNTDRAMANIENIPGGFEELRRLHNSIQEPMIDAISNQFQPNQNQSSNTQTQVDRNRPTTTPLPNPWGPSVTSNNTPLNRNVLPFSFPMGNTNTNSTNTSVPNLGNMNQLMSQAMSDPQLVQYIASGDIQSAQQYAMSNPQLLQAMMSPEILQSALAMMTNPAQNNNNNAMNSMPFGLGGLGTTSLPGMGSSMMPGLGMMPGWGGTGGMMPGWGGMGMTPGLWGNNSNNNNSAIGNNAGASTSTTTNNNQSSSSGTGGGAGQTGQRYAVQLQQLSDMGFTDTEKNIEALQSTNGNVDRAVERILGGF